MNHDIVQKSTGPIWLFEGIKGLVRDGDNLATALLERRPDTIFITLSDEHILGMKDFLEHPYEVQLSDYEIIYGVRLSLYGEVMTPSPVYIEAVKYATANGVPIVPLDMNEELYGGLYTDSMKSFDLVRHSVRKKRLLKKNFKDTTPEEFVTNWENSINRINGLRIIDEKRLEYIESRISSSLADCGGKSVLMVIDFEFAKRIEKFLEETRVKFTAIN